MARLVAALLSGIVFGLGLAIAAMTDPRKVLGFLDLAGGWDASLLFVLGGAVVVTAVAFRVVLKRPAPVFASAFDLPSTRAIDVPLVAGAALFGLGWGIGGYCPGPAIAALAAPNAETWLFLPAMAAGMALHRVQAAARRRDMSPEEAATSSAR